MRLDSKFEGKLWDYLLQALWGDVMHNSRLRFLQVKIKKHKYIYTYRERERNMQTKYVSGMLYYK